MNVLAPVLEQVRSQDAAEKIVAWWRDRQSSERRVLEVAGPLGAGKTAVLRRVAEQEADAVLLDTTSKSPEALLAEVFETFGAPPPTPEGPGWVRQFLDTVPVARRHRLVLLSNTQRSGATRTSLQGDLVHDTIASGLARVGLAVVVEVMPVTGPGLRRTRYVLPEQTLEDTCEQTTAVPPVLLTALALAEPRNVPVPVWSALAQAIDPSAAEGTDLQQLVDTETELFIDGPEGVSFRRESFADRLRNSARPELMASVGANIVSWLRAREEELRHPLGWAASGPVGLYAARGLAMHAAHSGHLPSVLEDGVALANIGQREILDAACAASKLGDAATDSAASDARQLWRCGVDPDGSQAAWAAWLHLTHTARGRTDVVRGIEASGVRLPWKTCWASWRPPGSISPELVHPGSLETLMHVVQNGRPAVLAIGPGADRQARVWDVTDGSVTAGPWKGETPASVSAELALPLAPDGHPLPDEPRKATLRDIERGEDGMRLCSLPIGEVRVYAGDSGLFAVKAKSGPTVDALMLSNSSLLPPFGRPRGPVPPAFSPPTRSEIEAYFGSGAVQRMSEDEVPSGLAHPSSRDWLTTVGLPVTSFAGLQLRPLADQGLKEIVWPDDPDRPDFSIGTWDETPVIIDGEDGQMLLLDEHEEDELIASSLAHFTALLLVLHRGLRMLSTRVNEHDAYLIRKSVDGLLSAIDHQGAQYDGWTRKLSPGSGDV
ncbi:SUKH-4 family immunity protein [Streptomyces sp. Pv4-95]|uniref:SUKH-4 family immunity protein n=1 Tax=Streptomyces sp. Pv4-95 TaxID=3049543 RepID=UPI0038921987